MAIRTPPSWLQNGSHPAENDRLTSQAIFATTGIIGSSSLAVTQNSPAGMSILIASGWAAILGTFQANMGAYQVFNDAPLVATITTANPSNPRIDKICLTVSDAFYTGALNQVAINVVAGTAAASPVAPATPTNSIVLATIAVGAGVTSILTANITDARVNVTTNLPAGMTNPLTTTGDTIYSSSGTTPARLGIGSTGQTLTVAGGVPTWANPASGSMTLLSTTAITAVASISITSIDQSYKSLQIFIDNAATSATGPTIRGTFNSITTGLYSQCSVSSSTGATAGDTNNITFVTSCTGTTNVNNISGAIYLPRYANTTAFQLGQFEFSYIRYYSPAATTASTNFGSLSAQIGAITSVQLFPNTGTWTAQGNIYIYGVN